MTHAIVYQTGICPTAEALASLYRSVGWGTSEPPELVRQAVERSGWLATAWDEDRLVGLARVLTDFVFVAYFQELLVHPAYQHQGVGKELLDLYDLAFGSFKSQVVVTEVEWVRTKFEKRGFHSEPAALSRLRPWSGLGVEAHS